MTDTIKEAVRAAYRRRALEVLESDAACCSPLESDGLRFGTALYEGLDTEGIPDTATMASLGCGNPTVIAGLRPGERVLDLGSGGGLDAFLAAKAVGRDGHVIGLDMTEEMLRLARRNLEKIGFDNVEFIKGEMEDIPLPDHSVDVIISNCVINLSPDKDAVFRQAHRVLAPGGRFAVTDVVTTREITPQEQADLASWTGCIAGALSLEQFRMRLERAGFRAIDVEPSHPVAPHAVSARITAIA